MNKVNLHLFYIVALLTSTVHAMETPAPGYDEERWLPELTNKTIDNVEEFSPAITSMLERELDLDKDILEIGSGPQGGILKYVGDRLNITPSEPNHASYLLLKEKYPRAIHVSARDIASKVDKKYDIIVLSNVLDCIMALGKEEAIVSLKSLKSVLAPNGKIVVLQYYNPDMAFVLAMIRPYNKQGLLAMPYVKRVENAILPANEFGISFVKKSELDIKLNSADSTIRGLIASKYLKQFAELFYEENAVVFQATLDSVSSFYSIATDVTTAKKHYGTKISVSQFTFNELFSKFVEMYGKQAGLKIKKNMNKNILMQQSFSSEGKNKLFAYAHKLSEPAYKDFRLQLFYSLFTLEQ